MATYVLKAETGHFHYQGSDVNLTVNRISQAVEGEAGIPPGAKKEVKDFIQSVLDSASDVTNELIVNIPTELAEFSEPIIAIIRALLGV